MNNARSKGKGMVESARPTGRQAIALHLLALALTTGCATMTPPEREPWAGTDDVGMIDESMITGRWALTVLNPLVGQETQTTRLIYSADGTLRGTLTTRNVGGMVENLSFALAGQWQTDGEWLTHSNVSLASRDGSPAGVAMSQMFSRQAAAGKADVFEASANRLLMVGDDGQAIRYDRLR